MSNIDGAINFDDLKHLLWQRYEHCNVWNEVWHDVHETVAKYRQITGIKNGKEPDKRINVKRMLCYIIYVPHINIVSVKATNITI